MCLLSILFFYWGNTHPLSNENTQMAGVEIHNLEAVDFSLLKESDIRNIAVMEVTTATLYKRNSTSEPEDGGLLDRRLGVCRWDRREVRCKTCETVSEQNKRPCSICPGHWGYATLCQPLYNITHLPKILKLLRCFCCNCGRILLSQQQQQKFEAENSRLTDLDRRLQELERQCKNNKVSPRPLCPHCDFKQQHYRRTAVDGICFHVSSGSGSSLPFTAYSCKLILDKITERDAVTAGFVQQHPKHMLCSIIAVPPISFRSNMASTVDGKKRENKLTLLLQKIMRTNKTLKAKGHTPTDYRLHSDICNLQSALNSYMNELMKTLCRKEGLIRKNLMGKRVNHSARTVITPDSRIKADEVGVPRAICMELTKQEIVTARNIDSMYHLLANGPKNYPGANYVVTTDGTRIPLMMRQNSIQLRYGYIVERHLVNGDIVLMNRQPSLHKLSMQAHKVRVMQKGNSFRLNLALTTPYNADFDGDEMNLHAMTTDATVCEAKELMLNQVISPKDGKPCIGCVQDSLLATFLMSADDVFIDRAHLHQLLMSLYDERDESKLSSLISSIPVPAILCPMELWTGKQVLSMVIPRDIYLERDKVVIHDGQLLTGRLNKALVGVSGGSLQHVITNRLNRRVTLEFLTDIQFIANEWLMSRGFSVGIADFIIDSTARQKIRQELCNAVSAANAVSGRKKEEDTNTILNKAIDNSSYIVRKSLSADNNMLLMADAGSKGSMLNIVQTVACVGQLNLKGERIRACLRSGRTLPHFKLEEANSAEARGFVDRGYIEHTTAKQFIPQCKAAREGLINTAITTSETGYIERRLAKSLEDTVVAYDGTVRNGNADIIQFNYGGDGMDPVKLEPQRLLSFIWKTKQFKQFCIWRNIADENRAMLRERRLLYQMYRSVSRGMKAAGLDGRLHLPVNLSRLITEAKHRCGTCNSGLYVLRERAAELLLRLIDSMQKRAPQLKLEGGVSAMQMLLLEQLCSKQVTQHHRLSLVALEWIIEQVDVKWTASAVSPGESVGIIAAQSISEPITQNTLNIHRNAGVSSFDATIGLPRIQEIFNGVSTPKTPFVRLHVDEVHALHDNSRLLRFCHMLERSNLCSLVDRVLLYTGNASSKLLDSDRELLNMWRTLYASPAICKQGLAVYLNPKLLDCFFVSDVCEFVEKRLLNQDAAAPHFFVIASDDNDCDSPVLHIRFRLLLNEKKRKRSPKQQQAERMRQLKKGKEQLERLKKLLCSEKKDVNMIGFGGFKMAHIDRERQEIMIRTSARADIRSAFDIRGCNPKSFYCNDIAAVAAAFGLYAARSVLRKELQNALADGGSSIDYHNLSVLVDDMTRSGKVLSIARSGISKEKNPLMKCTYEETYKTLANAAVRATHDEARGVSECIILGKRIPAGTGVVKLINTEFQPVVHEEEPSYCSSTALNAPLSPEYDSLLLQQQQHDEYDPEHPHLNAVSNGQTYNQQRSSKRQKTMTTAPSLDFATLFHQVQMETLCAAPY